MKFKLDENIPITVKEILNSFGYNTRAVIDQNLQGKSDTELWEAVLNEDRILITQDLDFADIRKYPLKQHPGIIILRLSNPSRRELIQKITSVFQKENIEQWRKCLVIITDRKIRIRNH